MKAEEQKSGLADDIVKAQALDDESDHGFKSEPKIDDDSNIFASSYDKKVENSRPTISPVLGKKKKGAPKLRTSMETSKKNAVPKTPTTIKSPSKRKKSLNSSFSKPTVASDLKK